MTADSMTDEQIRRLLAAASQDLSTTYPKRDDLRNAVLAEFRMHAKSHTSLRHDSAPPVETDIDAAVVDLEPVRRAHRPAWVPSPRVVIGVAASLAVLTAVVVGLRAQPTADTQASTTRPIPEEAGPDVALDPGGYSAEHLAAGLRLTLNEQVVVAEAGEDRIVLAPVDDAWRSSVTIMRADEPVEPLLTELESEGLVTLLRSAAPAETGFVVEFEVRSTNAARPPACPPGTSCLLLGPVELDPNEVNLVREMTSPTGEILWTVYRSETAYAPFQRAANEILTSLRFEP